MGAVKQNEATYNPAGATGVPDAIFQGQHLSLAYPGRRGQPPATILGDVSVDVERGGALTLVGPSGSGKSSLLRCLNRLEEPTAGTVRFDGRPITELDPRELRRRAALVQQTAVLFEGTVRDNLLVRSPGVAFDFSELRLRDMLAEVGLEPSMVDRDAATLSGGEKQRVTIARALLRDPQALLLDEPTSALDPPNAALVVETVSRLAKPIPGVYWIAATALTISTAATLAYVIGVVVQPRPWWEPQYVIPIAGMILGNSMTSAALAGDRLQADLFTRRDEVETRLALGFSGREAVQPLVRAALRAAMIPTVNGMMTVGVVQLPGMMTGQILAGASPLTAIRYQIVVVFMLAVATALGSLLFVRLAVGRYLTPAHQLRRYLL